MKRRIALLASGALLGLIGVAGLSPNRVTAADAKSEAPATRPADDLTKVVKSDAEWKKTLTETQYFILREKGTEPPFRNAYHDKHDVGTFVCAGCGLTLFGSEQKYDSHTGWPSFWRPIAPANVTVGKDADGDRDEVTCTRCGGHLGHVFNDGPPPTGLRYCMNSGAMRFVSAPK